MKTSVLLVIVLFFGDLFAGNSVTKGLSVEDHLVEVLKKDGNPDEQLLSKDVTLSRKDKQEILMLLMVAETGRADLLKTLLEKLNVDQSFDMLKCLRYKILHPIQARKITLDGGDASWVAFSPEGSHIAVLSFDAPVIMNSTPYEILLISANLLISDLAHDTCRKIHQKKRIQSAAWYTGTHICTGCMDKTTKTWDRSGSLVRTITHQFRVVAIACNRDGTRLVTACINGFVELRDGEGNQLKMLEQVSDVNAISWSNNGDCFVTGATDGLVHLYDKDGALLYKIVHGGSAVKKVALSSNGMYIASVGDNEKFATVWCKQKEHKILRHTSVVADVTFSPDEMHIITVGSTDRSVKVWDFEGTCLYTLNHNDRVQSVACSFDGSRIVIGCSGYLGYREGAYLQIWDMGGSILDWVVRRIIEGGDIALLELVLSKCETLQGLCDDRIILNLCKLAHFLKDLEPDKYQKICLVIGLLAQKSGAPL